MDLASLGRDAQLYPAARADHDPKVQVHRRRPNLRGPTRRCCGRARAGRECPSPSSTAMTPQPASPRPGGSPLYREGKATRSPPGNHRARPTRRPGLTGDGDLPSPRSPVEDEGSKELGRYFVGTEDGQDRRPSGARARTPTSCATRTDRAPQFLPNAGLRDALAESR